MGFTTDEAGPVRSGEQLDLERLATYLADHLGRRRANARRRAVPARAFEPDLPAPPRRSRAGPAPAAVRQPGQVGARHGARVPHPLPALPGLRAGPVPGTLLRRRGVPGGAVLPDGAAPGDHPPQAAGGRPSHPARDRAAALRIARSTAWPAFTPWTIEAAGLGGPGQAGGLRRAPGDRLVATVPRRPDRRGPRRWSGPPNGSRPTGRPSPAPR